MQEYINVTKFSDIKITEKSKFVDSKEFTSIPSSNAYKLLKNQDRRRRGSCAFFFEK